MTYLYTNAAFAAGLPNGCRLTQEKITGRRAAPFSTTADTG